ncbi:hypothetical protein NY99_06805 [Xanthomonas phaseoli pv. phaseoli]|uniref:metallophosphoesterase n=1 Tax=Xanthomonas phaseoli TaxID=1985254 RepID=UPI000536F146|nr:metallophosphoesterase [Xanthomonas phaseoli]KGU56924.1 hypothetical protein NY99_06805 [Xanthomonas phaseoli pv. phaseoli]KHF48416.1 hypothetical protein QQ30_11045 [Xanthomonas phaseoli pv. phaseoli]KHS25713.1 hypothetical protein RM60_17355 [Xanthomonas phaseoli pv. phaseoli]
MFHLTCALLCLYLMIRFVYPLRIAAAWRMAIGMLLLVVSMNRLLSTWIFGDMFSPEIPGWIIGLIGAMFGAMLFLSCFTLIGDLVGALAWLGGGRTASRTLLCHWRRYAGGIAIALGLLSAWNGSRLPEVRHVPLQIAQLPAELSGLRLVQLSDTHVSPLLDRSWLKRVVDQTNAENPDVIVITGDLIDGWVRNRESDIAPLAELRARNGVYASLGNHEYYFDADAWTSQFEKLGIHVLRNSRITIVHNERKLVLAATTDEAAPEFDHAGPAANLAVGQTLPEDVVVLLRHRPTGLNESQQLGVDLQLSGHTHGGMIRGLDQVIARANGGFVSGLYQVGTTQLYVSNGTGIWNGFPLRLGRPPEITVFEFSPEAGQN